MDKLKKLKLFAENPQLALQQEATLTNDKLDQISVLLQRLLDKETPEPPPFPEIPEPKEPDLSKIESLLTELRDLEEKEIAVELKIT